MIINPACKPCGVYFCTMHFRQDTIVAKATPSGEGAIGIIRISGDQCLNVVQVLLGGAVTMPASHSIKVKKFYAGNKLVDEGMLAIFKAPASFTGENMAELYVHGSDFIISALLNACIDLGCRLADPGEFTLRAYLNGKLDLAQAEAVADLIASQSEGAHKLALNQLKGGISHKISELRGALLEFAALIELELDFGEEDVEFASREQLRDKIDNLKTEVARLYSSFKSGNAIKDGVPVAIVGKPNAGKSTLLNALLGEERAIVTDIPGTTRDTIEEYFMVDGIRFRLIDTAGIRQSDNLVEEIGIQRTFDSVAKASLVLLLVDVSTGQQEDMADLIAQIKSHTQGEVWIVNNKTDLRPNHQWSGSLDIAAGKGDVLALQKALAQYAHTLLSEANDVTISNVRHAQALKNVLLGLESVVDSMDKKQSGDILAFELRQAMSELGKITGAIDSDEVLGEIFGKFCIGK
jgi:tRNA modification GTPase